MTTDFYNLLLSDCALAVVLLGLFWYVQRISRDVRGVVAWGVAHLAYSVGAVMLDGTSRELASAGDLRAAYWITGIGGLLACAGMAGLGLSIVQFVGQRSLARREWALLPLCVGFSVAGWAFWGTADAQGAAMSAAEVIVLAIMVWHLRLLRTPPDRVPARLMILGCIALIALYASDLGKAITGRYGPNALWVNADLSIWFLLNFCMLMLTSFRAAESLRLSALFDPLTRALNRRGLETALRKRRTTTDGAPALAVIALDLDHFKSINDRHGHATGDLVLQRFSDTVRGCIRGDDLFARIGGEEFVVVLHDSPPDNAQHLAERIREQVAALEMVHDDGAQVRVTVSLGVGSSLQRPAFAALMRSADEALYEAKRLGRNRVEARLLQA